ncbi:MAG: ABC transporter permease [Firmicutes bacterium]|nr:ABC transporter permease [Lachnospiraceae bacterium]MDD6066240.1 ABC transporter permease [Bacillota bacterium]MDY2820143.1 ABC transporter permease [Hominisplanchenecus sp.]
MSGVALAMLGAVSQGVLWGLMVLGVYITYKILDIADLTVDGSFALGGCVCASMIAVNHMNPVLAILVALAAGLLAGAVTGFLHTVFDIPAILSGILTQIALWSINLRIMGGKSNVPLLKSKTIFTATVENTGLTQSQVALIVGVIIAAAVIAFLYWFFGTELGAALRATGNNEAMIRALGVDIRKTKMIALMLSNGLVAVSGALVCQSQKFGDINMGTGAIVIGLASIVIGEVLLGRLRSFGSKLISAVVGSVVYFLIRAIVLQLGMNANDMKLLSAIIVAFALCIPVAVSKWKVRRSYSEGGQD